MDKKLFYANLNKFSRILLSNDTNIKTFLFNSVIYVEGIRKSLSVVENYCKEGSRILDLGCGTGFLSMQLGSSGFRVDGLDVEHNPETIEEFKKKDGLQTRIWRGLENVSTSFLFYEGVMLPFDDQCFDAVVAHAVVEHISPNVVSSLFQEIKRVLKPCGYFFLFRTPRKQALTEHMARTLHMGSHNKLMGEQELISMLTMNGFEVISFRRTDLVFGVLRGRMQNIWNLMSPALLMVDEMLLETPLSRLAHHMQVVCQKPVESKVK